MSSNAANSYTILRGLFLVLAICLALGGAALVFATSSLYPLILAGAASTPPVDLLLKGVGAVVLGLSYLAYSISRDPVRYVAAIDAVIIVLIVVVLIEVYEMVTRGVDSVYPNHLLLLSTILRAALAAVLIILRPRAADFTS